ncbi:helix-turn-helix domain-containing protein [Oerskovia sp. NPDC060287]|uniref:helix-turn-helix domain-containing protein n=1 Tax=Oerskovia sp. NPDC060287 TaxID=3347095 RepID=UPI0036487DD5
MVDAASGGSILSVLDRFESATDTAPSPDTGKAVVLYDQQSLRCGRGKRKVTPEVRHQMTERRRQGAQIKELAAEFDLNRSSINDIVRAEGIPARKPAIGPECRDEIVRLYGQGLSIAKVALRFGVSDDVMYFAYKRLAIPTRPRRGGIRK